MNKSKKPSYTLQGEELVFFNKYAKIANKIISTEDKILLAIMKKFFIKNKRQAKRFQFNYVTTVYLAGNAIESYKLMLIAFKKGLKQQGYTMLRFYLEACIDLLFLCQNKKYIQRYLDFHLINDSRISRTEKIYSHYNSDYKSKIKNGYQYFTTKYKITDHNKHLKTWAGFSSIRELAEKTGEVGKSMYHLYDRCSKYIHPSSSAWHYYLGDERNPVYEDIVHHDFYDACMASINFLTTILYKLIAFCDITVNDRLIDSLETSYKDLEALHRDQAEWYQALDSLAK